MSAFKKAVRSQAKLRLALLGPSGSGKTYTALSIAKHLGQRVAVIDTERGSASLYAGSVADFDVLEPESFSPATYVKAIKDAEKEGYDVIVIDSLTHAWSGKGGALEMVDHAAKRSSSANTYMAWRDVTPEHNALVDAMVSCKAHLITTIRVKTAYELQENDRGKKVPVKIGLEPIQRGGLEYEFTVTGDMDLDHVLTISKTRCSAMDGGVYKKPGQNIAEILLTWLNEGAPAPGKPAHVARVDSASSPAQTSEREPHIEVGLNKAEQIAMMVEMDLPKLDNADLLIDWAREMVALHGPVKGTAPWKAFAARCEALQLNAREIVNAATKAA